MQTWTGLTLALCSAIAVNWAYTREHAAVASMPSLSPRHPIRSLTVALQSRFWLIGFGVETSGWLLYVAAVRLAPLALVQAVCASGIAVLALVSSHGRPSALAPNERLGVLIAFAGLVLLAISLIAPHEGGRTPDRYAVVLWLGASFGVALALIGANARMPGAAALGLASGLLFAAGDISTKVVVLGGAWLIALISLVVCYAVGTSVLQAAFQRGNALTAAGIATLTTNAVPIAAGLVLFREPLPDGIYGTLRIAAFASLVIGATVLADLRGPRSGEAPTRGLASG
jgi:hypothetical protein